MNMNIYRLALRYYIESDDYIAEKEYFLLAYNYTGFCADPSLPYEEFTGLYTGEELPAPYLFESEISLRNKALTDIELGEFRHISERITDKNLERYFTNYLKYPIGNEYLFAVFFAYTNDLSDKQITQIADLRHRKICRQILDYFLLNPTQQLYCSKQVPPPLKCLVSINGVKIGALRDEKTGSSLRLSTGETLGIL